VKLSGELSGSVTEKIKEEGKEQGIFEFDLKIFEFCPKFANFIERQGINRESLVFLPSSWQQSACCESAQDSEK